MRDVSVKGGKQYLRTRNAASSESVKRAKQIAGQGAMGTNMLFQDVEDDGVEQQRLDMLAKVSGFRPQETVFEIGRRGGTNTETADLIRRQRERIENRERKIAARRAVGGKQMADAPQSSAVSFHAASEDQASAESEDELELTQPAGANMDEASDSELELTFSAPAESASKGRKKTSGDSWQDSEHFMSYTPTGFNAAEDRGYGVHSGGTSSHFVNAAKDATMDLAQDESSAFKEASKPGMRWDKKKKDYVRRENDEDGSKGQKFIRGESGQKIPASFRSGRFDAWRKANKVERMPRVGELERSGAHYHWDQFAPFHSKIIHRVIDDPGSAVLGSITWDHEDFLRNALLHGVFPELVGTWREAHEGDVLIVSDVDEIPKPETLVVLRKCEFPDRLTLRSDFYYYSFQWLHAGEKWAHPQVTTYRGLTSTIPPKDLRNGEPATHGFLCLNHVRSWWQRADLWDAAWHCSSCFATVREMQTKMESFSHTSWDTAENRDPKTIIERVGGGRDLFGREDQVYERAVENRDVPAYILQHSDRFGYLLDRDGEHAGFTDVGE
ncbi:hypothetical protein LTR87_005296 [Friedmanniomyces endolithicus]|nr:hypothetical protein LTR87_005296 [Friedmanniomyces endolithicus]